MSTGRLYQHAQQPGSGGGAGSSRGSCCNPPMAAQRCVRRRETITWKKTSWPCIFLYTGIRSTLLLSLLPSTPRVAAEGRAAAANSARRTAADAMTERTIFR